MSQLSRPSLVSSSRTAIAAVALLMIFTTISAVAQPASPPPEQPSMETARAHFQHGNWPEARTALIASLEQAPEDGGAWYLLGLTLYYLEDYAGASEAFGKAALLGERVAASKYSMACALALDGRTSDALDAFEAALEAGFDDIYLIADDHDLDSLRDHPRFRKLYTPPPPYEPHPDARAIEMTAPSGLKVFGELYAARSKDGEALGKSAPAILLFHQAGSNGAEYQAIAPRLANEGFHAFAIDARGGGRSYGRDNKTIEAHGERGTYDDAMEEFRVATAYLRAQGYPGPFTVWGSSYSASRVFRLLAEDRDGLVAALGFDPGPPVDEQGDPIGSLHGYPVFVTWEEAVFGEVQRGIFDRLQTDRKVLFEQTGGRHGSSTLNARFNPNSELVWKAVLDFLAVAATPKAEPEYLSGPYFGQKPPGSQAELFAPGTVNTGLSTRDLAMTPDGKEIYFGVMSGGRAYIMVSRQVDGIWSEPRVASFSGVHLDLEPCISPDGKRFFFLSTRPQEGQEPKPGWVYQDIWVMDREGDDWGEPYNLGSPVNSDAPEYFPSVTSDSTLYFTREGEARQSKIYRSRWVDGSYQEPELLPEQVNAGKSQFNAFVAPDESFLIVPMLGHPDSLGGIDYFVVFRDAEDNWSEPINMGPELNTAGNGEYSASLSPDGKILFFMSSRTDDKTAEAQTGKTLSDLVELSTLPAQGDSNIYWIDAALIETLRRSDQEQATE